MTELYPIYHSEVPAFMRELLDCPALVRLGGLGMNCGCEYTTLPRFRELQPYTRLQHSIGVGLIVWHFTQDAAQAIAGLLHDISTPTFAHVIDFLNGDNLRQESTEADTSLVIAGDFRLMSLLRKHGLRLDQVDDYHRYPIADNDSPRLSADRLEYTMGNFVNYRFGSVDQVRRMYEDIIVAENESGEPELSFRTPEIALEFAQAALQCSNVYVADEDRYAMTALACLLRDAIHAGVISRADLNTIESMVITKLLSNEEFADRWFRFRRYRRILTAQEDPKTDGWYNVPAKKRYIDPWIANEGRVSDRYPEHAALLQEFRERSFDFWLSGE